MVGAPPMLTLKRQFSRPSAAQIEAFAEVPTGFVVDALDGRGRSIRASSRCGTAALPGRR